MLWLTEYISTQVIVWCSPNVFRQYINKRRYAGGLRLIKMNDGAKQFMAMMIVVSTIVVVVKILIEGVVF